MMTLDEAVRHMRSEPAFADLVSAAYLGADVEDAALRFAASGEFGEVKRLLGERLPGATVLDLGAGTGIASRAFIGAGATRVFALEPDSSDEVGQGAIRRLRGDAPIEIVSAYAERLPLADASVDVVYARQVLHHTRDLRRALAECARVLKAGGVLLACREHIVDDEDQLQWFLDHHPMHQLAGGENAYSLPEYVAAIRDAGLALDVTLQPWDSVINAFPAARDQRELRAWPGERLRARFGIMGAVIARLPGVEWLYRRRLNRSVPGRMYSFLARKPR